MEFNKFLTLRKMNEATEGGEGSSNVADYDGADPNETFDNLDYESEASKNFAKKFEEKFKDKIEAKKAAAGKKEEKPSEEEKPTKKGKDLDLLEEDEEKEKEEKPEPKKEDKKAEEKEEKPEDGKKEEPKKIKIRMSDGLYGIEADAKVRVKIDGEFQEVPVQELINNYSGKTAWDKKFTEIGNEKKQLEMAKQEIVKTQEFLKGTLEEVLSKINGEDANPFDALFFLVEKAGGDIYTVWRRSMEANLEEVEKLMDMSDIERKAYFLEKKDEFRTKAEENRKKAIETEQRFNQALQKVNQLRQAHGVSEEQYLQALDELEAQGIDTTKLDDEKVVDYASLKPHVNDVQDVLEPYEAQIDDSKYSEIVQRLARQLRANEFTKEQLSEWAKQEFADEDLKDLSSRVSSTQKKASKVEVKTPEKALTLDFDDEE